MRRKRRKCLVLCMIPLSVVTVLSFYCLASSSSSTLYYNQRNYFRRDSSRSKSSFISIDDFRHHPLPRDTTGALVKKTPETTSDNRKCTMYNCFDVSRCLQSFKVFVYPPDPNEKPSSLYKKFLSVIRDSPYFTENPQEACLLVLNLDTLDRDTLSKDFVRHLPEKLKKLPHWNNGRNHLIFNFYSGSFPDYSDKIDFPHGEAILAKASFSCDWYRKGFDISLPLLHKNHREHGKVPGGLTTRGNLFPVHRRYLLVFKGKRYLWGLGSQTRNALHHLNNDKDVVMLTTCKHGKFWDKHKDYRCLRDNLLYDKYDYKHLITNSTFCLVPRGRRLGSFRFLESLQAGCIPVSLSNGFILPFQEIIDWDKAVFSFDERQLFQVPHVLRNVPQSKILSMRLQTQLYWEEYLSSIEKVVMTTLEIIKHRLQSVHNFHYIWNRYPGGLVAAASYSHELNDYPFYSLPKNNTAGFTAVVLITQPAPKGNSPVVILMKNLCNSTHLRKIILLWVGVGRPQVMSPSHCNSDVKVLDKRDQKKHMRNMLLPLNEIKTDAILMLSESVNLILDEVEFGYTTWLTNPERLVGYTSQRHYWSPAQRQWRYSTQLNNKYSLVSTRAAFFHRYYAHYMINSLPTVIRKISDSSNECFGIALNFVISDLVGKPPLKVTQRLSLSRPVKGKENSLLHSSSSCLNLLANAYGYMPLRYSLVRSDPVLFKDNVSIQRKRYRRLESIK